MMGRRAVTVIVGALMVAMVAAGCRTSEPRMNKAASERATAFYRAFFLAPDYGQVWDMSLPGTFEERTREEFMKAWERVGSSPVGDRKLELQEFPRVDDFLYLLSDSQNQMLIWVTKASGGWKVRKYQWHYGGPIPW